MNEPTAFIYTFVTADIIRLRRFVQRWREAGIPAIRALGMRILMDSVPDTTDIGKCQRRLLGSTLANVDWFRLGYALQAYHDQKPEDTHAAG